MNRLVPHASLFLLVALLAPSALAQATGVSPSWEPLPDALAQAQRAGQPILVYVRAAWCAPCYRLERETFADPRVAQRLGHFARARLTLDDHDRHHRVGPYRLSEAEWSARFGAESTPTLVLLAPDGSVLARRVGFLEPAHLLPILDAALAAPIP